MARNLEHLELPRWQESLPRRKHGGASSQPDKNCKAHGQELTKQVDKVSDDLLQRKQQLPPFINPKLIFKLKRKGSLQEEDLRKMGLNLLSQDANRVIVVFPDEESLSALKNRLEAFTSEKMKYAEFFSIEAIEPLVAEDRIGRRLKETPLREDEIAPLDIELWHAGSRDECRSKINEIKNYLNSLNLSVTDEWIGERLCLMRAKVNLEAFKQIIEIDYVKEVDRRPTPTFEMGDLLLDLSNIHIESADRDVSGLTGVLIIDSGVMQQHPLVKPVLGDAQVFPDKLREKIIGGAEDGDQRTGGHGTAVAGIAVYNHIGECIEKRFFEPHTQLFSARVTDENNNYDEDELLEHQLNDAVEYFLRNYPAVKVINISLGNDGSVYSQGMYQFRFAAAIDELAYKHRDKEIVFVCSSGNFSPQELSDEEIKQQYPKYLLEDRKSRIIDPATSALALTVGGLSHGSGKSRSPAYEKDVSLLVADEIGFPSPFTCTGFGVDGAIKPDLVDFAGDWRFERGRIANTQPQHAGVPTLAKNFAPPNGQLFRTVAGTSFAAPRVANLAARLFNEFPSASSNLIRAMIADSARIPKVRPALFESKDSWAEEILRVYG